MEASLEDQHTFALWMLLVKQKHLHQFVLHVVVFVLAVVVFVLAVCQVVEALLEFVGHRIENQAG